MPKKMEPESCDDCVVVEGDNPSVMELQLCPLHAAAKKMLAALKQVSFYSRINHAKFKDYGEVVDAVLKDMGQPTGMP